MIRVTHVLTRFGSATERLLLAFARHADRDRFDFRLICLGARSMPTEFASRGWKVACLADHAGGRAELPARLGHELARRRTDVVHTHDDESLVVGGPAARLAGVPVIIHSRYRAKTGPRRSPVRLMARLTKRFVCGSEVGRRASEADGIPTNRLTVIRGGIDTAEVACTGPRPGGPVVVLGRRAPLGAIDSLLRGASAAFTARPEFRCEIDVADEVRHGAEALARNLDVADRVRLLRPGCEVAAAVARAACVVHPSTGEAVSRAVLEAMARGIPVIAFAGVGSRQVVEDGVTGQLVPPTDPVALAGALLALGSVSDRSRALGRAGRDRVERLFDIRHTVEQYQALYLKSLARGNRGIAADPVPAS